MYTGIYFWGDYEPYHTKIFKRIVRPGDVVFDIGANFGWFTTLFARWVGPSGRVHGFEPVPFIHELAAETVKLNGMESRVQLNRLALGRSDGELTVHTFPGLPHGHASASDLGRSDAQPHTCEVRQLGSVLPGERDPQHPFHQGRRRGVRAGCLRRRRTRSERPRCPDHRFRSERGVSSRPFARFARCHRVASRASDTRTSFVSPFATA